MADSQGRAWTLAPQASTLGSHWPSVFQAHVRWVPHVQGIAVHELRDVVTGLASKPREQVEFWSLSKLTAEQKADPL